MNNNEAYTLITGGSTGIGKAIAEECARRKRNLLLVALTNDELKDSAEEINVRYDVKVLYYQMDLTEEAALEAFYQWCVEQHLKIDMLVNNAGIGGHGGFDSSEGVMNRKMIRLNVEAMVTLTHLFIPLLLKQPKSYILNIASLASLHPVPYKTVYAATKSFVYYFSQGLRKELRDKSISVSVVSPGPVATNDAVIDRIGKQSALVRYSLLSAEKVAVKSLNGLFAGKAFIIPGRINRLYARVSKLVPDSLITSIFARKINYGSEKEKTSNKMQMAD